MTNQFIRSQYIFGEDYREKIEDKKIIIFGVGGVGGICIEYLVRAGIYDITLVDYDTIDITNLNRQVTSLHSNIGESKVFSFKKRLLDINPDLKINIRDERLEDNIKSIESFNLKDYSYVIDCIDDVKSKISLIEYCYKNNIKIISRMGTGNKTDLRKLKVSDIYETKYCRLARIVRKELKKRNVKNLKVVYSDEDFKDFVPGKVGTSPFVPTGAGLLIAQEVFNDLLGM